MTQKEPTTLPGRCTTVATRDNHYEGYKGNQVVNKSTNTRPNKTIINFSTHHLHAMHHVICHPSKQTEAKCGKGCPPEGTEI